MDSRALVDNDLLIRDFSSARNRVFSAESGNGPSYLLKQSPYAEANVTAREAEVYQHLSSVPAMRRFMPQCYGYDAHLRILVLEFVSNAEDLASYHRGLVRPPIRVASAIGAILAELHGVSIRRCRSGSPEARPSALTVHRPHIRMARDCSPACLELVRILQNTEGYGSRLDELNETWAARSLIHRDVRHKNFLLTAPARTMRHTDLKLIDWELACLGDPRWDIGSALGNYLSLWLQSIPMAGMASLPQLAEIARCPLDQVQPAIRACWHSYATRRGLVGEATARLSLETVGFAAARLIQTAYEAAQGTNSLTAASVLHLQVALNMLTSPQDAVTHLYGLTLAQRVATSTTEVESRDAADARF